MKKKFMYICLTTGLFSSGILVNNLNAGGYYPERVYHLFEIDCHEIATKACETENQINQFFNNVISPILMIKTDNGLVFDRLLNSTINQVPSGTLVSKIRESLNMNNSLKVIQDKSMGQTIEIDLVSMVIELTGYNTEKGEVKVSVSMHGDNPCFSRKVKRDGDVIFICSEY